jgi:hypothetical protein
MENRDGRVPKKSAFGKGSVDRADESRKPERFCAQLGSSHLRPFPPAQNRSQQPFLHHRLPDRAGRFAPSSAAGGTEILEGLTLQQSDVLVVPFPLRPISTVIPSSLADHDAVNTAAPNTQDKVWREILGSRMLPRLDKEKTNGKAKSQRVPGMKREAVNTATAGALLIGINDYLIPMSGGLRKRRVQDERNLQEIGFDAEISGSFSTSGRPHRDPRGFLAEDLTQTTRFSTLVTGRNSRLQQRK